VLEGDTIVYVSNADKSYESLRTPVSVTVQPNPIITSSGSLEFCEGETIVLSVDEGEEYTWSTAEKTQDIEVDATGNYTVAVRNGSLECTSLSKQVIVHPNPTPSFIVTTEVIGAGDQVDFFNQSTGATSWHWDFGDGETSVEENPVHSYSMAGSYTITFTATSDKGCEATEIRSIGIITDTETPLEKTIVLYPNPVYQGGLGLKTSAINEPMEINIFNVQGALVYHQTIKANETLGSLSLSNLANGVYQVRITRQGENLTKKIVIAR
jgi:PKD repeat protein